MADTYDVIICGAGSAGGFMAGEIAAHGSVLILDAGSNFYSDPANPGTGVPLRRALATQLTLGTWLPDSKDSPHGHLFFAYPMDIDQSNPFSSTPPRPAPLLAGRSSATSRPSS